MNNLCLGWMCNLRDSCGKYIPNAKLIEGMTRYFLPFNTGEHCEHFEQIQTKVKDSTTV